MASEPHPALATLIRLADLCSKNGDRAEIARLLAAAYELGRATGVNDYAAEIARSGGRG